MVDMGRVASVAMVTVIIPLVVMMLSMVVHMMILAQVPNLVECIIVGESYGSGAGSFAFRSSHFTTACISTLDA